MLQRYSVKYCAEMLQQIECVKTLLVWRCNSSMHSAPLLMAKCLHSSCYFQTGRSCVNLCIRHIALFLLFSPVLQAMHM